MHNSILLSYLISLVSRHGVAGVIALSCFLLPVSVRAQFENTFYGSNAGYFNSTGDRNSAFGDQALVSNKDGSDNVAVGLGALANNKTSQNTAVGSQALLSNTSGPGNTATGFQSLYHNGSGYNNVANGWQTLYSNTAGAHNTATGAESLYTNTADFNTAAGSRALYTNSTGSNNTATGYTALYNNSSGSSNTAQGFGALSNNTTGSNNVAIGRDAGANLTTGSNNITIGAGLLGKTGEANTTRIGKTTQAATYIGGIYNKNAASGTAVPVLIDSTGKLGTVKSSARYKEAIKPMDKTSEAILKLEPVTFNYKKELDPDGVRQFGLIAEQVEKVDPDLVVRDEDGKVSTVRYEAVNAMLLNEFLKEHRKLQTLQTAAEQQEATITDLKLAAARQEKQIRALTAGLQKVGARIELEKPSPRVTANH
jgi:hypothetical protein